MRRLIIEEPVTRSAIWSRRLGWFALAVAAIGIFLMRAGRVELTAGFAVLGAGLLFAFASLALAVIAFVLIWTEGRRGLGLAVWGFVLSTAILAWPAFLGAKAVYLPRLSDISTDVSDPPAFARSRAALAARDGHVPPDVPPATRELQRDAYPAVTTLFLDVPPEDAFEAVRKAAGERGWQVIETTAPGGRIGTGRLEAIDRSLLLRFPDDITVRLRPRADGTRVDVRSASRVGNHDLGVNAARIGRFLASVETLAAGQ